MLNIPTTEERLGRSPQRVVRYFVLVMAMVYAALGVWLWYTSGRPTPAGALVPLGPVARRVLGTVFVLYGLIRFARAYQLHFHKSASSSSADEPR